MNKDEIIKKEIDCHISIKTHMWNALIVSIGGTLTLIQHLNSKINIFLFILGILLIGILFVSYFNRDDNIERLFKKLREGK